MSGTSPAWHVDQVSKQKVAFYQGGQLIPSPVCLWRRPVPGLCLPIPCYGQHLGLALEEEQL